MSKIVKIHCEGKKGSHDYDILYQTLPIAVMIEPIGSVRGAAAIIQYKESNVVKSDFQLLFRDRDFDRAIPESCILESDGKYAYFSYRNTIENYLFDSSLFYEFIRKYNLSTKYSIYTETDVRDKFIQAARKIRYYQAIRHTLGAMRKPTDFGTKIHDKSSGVLPFSLEEEYCRTEALQRIFEKKEVVSQWTEDVFDEILNNFLTKFNDDFINDLKFLVYFQGKDFAASLKSILHDFPLENYYKFAKSNFDYTKHPDLQQLRQIIETQLV
jgi:hypothetical protein